MCFWSVCDDLPLPKVHVFFQGRLTFYVLELGVFLDYDFGPAAGGIHIYEILNLDAQRVDFLVFSLNRSEGKLTSLVLAAYHCR